MKTLDKESLAVVSVIPPVNEAAWAASLESLLEQLDADAGEFPLRERHRLWLLRGVVLRLLGKTGEAAAQFKSLSGSAPARTLVVQAAAKLELCETRARQGFLNQPHLSQALRWLERAGKQKTAQVCGKTEAKKIPGDKKEMLKSRFIEMRGYLAAMMYDPEGATKHVRQALTMTQSQIQQQQCRALLTRLRGSEEEVREQIREPAFLRRRDQSIYQELWELTTEPMEEVVSL